MMIQTKRTRGVFRVVGVSLFASGGHVEGVRAGKSYVSNHFIPFVSSRDGKFDDPKHGGSGILDVATMWPGIVAAVAFTVFSILLMPVA